MAYASWRHFEHGYRNIFLFICCHKLSAFILPFYCSFFFKFSEMIFIASISTYVTLYCNSTAGNYIILKECDKKAIIILFIVVNLVHALRIMRLPVVEIQCDDAYVPVLVDAIKSSLWELEKVLIVCQSGSSNTPRWMQDGVIIFQWFYVRYDKMVPIWYLAPNTYLEFRLLSLFLP